MWHVYTIFGLENLDWLLELMRRKMHLAPVRSLVVQRIQLGWALVSVISVLYTAEAGRPCPSVS